MNSDIVALLLSVVIMIVIAVWVPFLDTCAHHVQRRQKSRRMHRKLLSADDPARHSSVDGTARLDF